MIREKIRTDEEKKLTLLGYFDNTKKVYLYFLGLFLNNFQDKNIQTISQRDIELFIYNLMKSKELSYFPKLQLINAIKFYYEKIIKMEKGGKYSEASIAKILKNSASKAGINKNVTPHILKHSFATHLPEQGVDLRYIQELLGHSSSKTTEIYTHVSTKNLRNIITPSDSIFLDKEKIYE